MLLYFTHTRARIYFYNICIFKTLRAPAGAVAPGPSGWHLARASCPVLTLLPGQVTPPGGTRSCGSAEIVPNGTLTVGQL